MTVDLRLATAIVLFFLLVGSVVYLCYFAWLYTGPIAGGFAAILMFFFAVTAICGVLALGARFMDRFND